MNSSPQIGNNGKTTVTGYKYLDTDGNGERASTLIQGEKPNVVLVLDTSGSTNITFQGTQDIPDLNNDNRGNTVLDSEIAAAGALHAYLHDSGYTSSNLGLVEFNEGYDWDPINYPSASIIYDGLVETQDASGNFKFNESAKTLQSGGGTDFDAGLLKAEELVKSWNNGPANIIFLSDGEPNGGDFGVATATRLTAEGYNIQAFGVGSGARVDPLNNIDSDGSAYVFTSSDNLFDVLSGNLTGDIADSVTYTEDGVPGIEIYLDIDGNGTHDQGEPKTTTDQDGNYSLEFSNPLNNVSLTTTYYVREIIPSGYQQTEAPISGGSIVLDNNIADATITDINFGNIEQDEPIVVPSDPPVSLAFADFTPPYITGASIDGNSVTVAFNEEIQDVADKSLLDNNRFDIKINKRSATINSYSLDSSGRSVTLELEKSATPRDNVTVGYKDSTNNQLDGVIQDIAGNDMDSLSKKVVTVTSTSTVLSIISAEAEGRQIELSFNDSLKRTIPKARSIKVTANGEKNKVKDIIIGSDQMTVTLMMQRDINPGEEVQLTYKDASGDQKKRVFQNDLGDDLSTINKMTVTTGSYDGASKPELVNASGMFDEITMNFDQTLKKGRLQPGLFQVKSGSQTYRVRKASVAKRSSQVILELKNNLPLFTEDPLTISYMDMNGDQTRGVVQAISGLDAGSITDAQLLMF
ncbi:MAG TPA: hypothetical protein DCL40_00510 [Coxiellaceae bacterium]|nr:hypothetical protein [Coxiellaceae bacterium]